MVSGIEKVIGHIRSKSKVEWQSLFRDKVLQVREYVRKNGEKSALFAFISGIFLVMFFKLTLIMVCLTALVYLLVLLISDA